MQSGKENFNMNKETIELARNFAMNVTCDKCIHFKVCSIMDIMQQGLRQSFAVEKVDNDPTNKNVPLNIVDVAKICKFYSSRTNELSDLT